MIILFVATQGGSVQAPSLPDLHIQDSDSGANIPVGGLEGWDSDFIQTQSLCYGPLQFESEAVDFSGESDQFWARRLSTILVRSLFSASGATATVHIVREDGNGVKSYSEPITITATSVVDGGKYHGGLIVAPTYGANKVSLNVVSVSSGTIDVRLAGV